MEDGSKRWFLPFWQFPGLLAKLLLTPAISTERALIFISNVFFSSYVHIHCSVKTFKTSHQNDFKLYFSLFERFHPTFTPGFCWSGSRVDKSRNPRGSTLLPSSQEVSTSFATTIVHHFVFFILETLYPPLLVLMRSLHLVGTFRVLIFNHKPNLHSTWKSHPV